MLNAHGASYGLSLQMDIEVPHELEEAINLLAMVFLGGVNVVFLSAY